MAVATPAPGSPRGSGTTFSGGKRWLRRLALAAGLLLSSYVLFLSNVIAFRHPVRFDLTAERLYSLSAGSRERLRLVGETVRVIIPVLADDANPALRAELEVLERALAILQEIIAVQPLVRLEAKLDVILRPDRWEEVRAQYGLTRTQLNRFVFVAGPNGEFRESVTPRDLASFGAVADPRLDVPEVVEFRGEKALVDAIVRLTRRERRPVYFVQDRGELLLEAVRADSGPGAAPELNAVRSELATSGLEPRSLEMSGTARIPDDCALLVIARPLERYAASEQLVIEEYLERGGALFVALGPATATTGLESLLARWGVGVEEGTVHVHRQGDLGRQLSGGITLHRFHAEHPATAPFRNVRFALRLEKARALARKTHEHAAQRVAATPLLETYFDAARGEMHLLMTPVPGNPEKILKDDRQGGFPVAVAVEGVVPARPPPSFQPLDTRIVVIGAASFLRDNELRGHALDFFRNCVFWLIGDEERATTATGEAWQRRSLDMSGGFREWLSWVPTLVFPGLFLVAGAVVYFLRRA